MIAADTIQLALRNLRQSKLRTGLTTLGVSIGVASLAGMVSLGVGLQDQLVGRFMQTGLFDSITVLPASAARALGARGLGRGGPFAGRGLRPRQGSTSQAGAGPALDDQALHDLAALDQVIAVYPNIRVPLQLTFRDQSQPVIAIGVPLSSRGDGAFQNLPFGAFFTGDADEACLLSLEFAKGLTDGDPKDLVGQQVALTYATAAPATPGADPSDLAARVRQIAQKTANYTIAGIVEREPGFGLGGGPTGGLMLPLGKARQIDADVVTGAQSLLRGSAATKTYSSLTVRVRQARSTQDVEDRIKTMGFTAFSVNDALQGAKRAFILLDIVLSLIGSIALAVSSLGIVNTMVMSILERTREIGIMKAIGASDGDVRTIFLIEASAIGLIGGFAGVALGWLVGRAINLGANLYIQSQGGTPATLFSLPFWLIGGAIGFSIVVSLLAGSYPAARAARLDPIQALRHD
ncbi:MAG: ABC transporter permease [Acidobacteriia bacterium]|nr:ABC transporter permease [Terriglobia bacterium]